MSDNKKILQTLKSMPKYHMNSETKSSILKSLQEQSNDFEKKHKRTRIIGSITKGTAAFALAALLLLAVFTPEGKEFLGRLWNNASGPGQNLVQDDNTAQNPAQGDNGVKPAQNSPGPDFTSVQMIDGASGWAATTNNILHTTDGGHTWANVTPGGITGEIRSFFVDANQGYAAAPNSLDSTLYIYFTSDGGKSWSKKASPENGYANIQFLDAKKGWILLSQGVAMSHEEVAIIHTTEGNNGWSTITKTDTQGTNTSGELPFSGDKTGMYFADDNNGWITGSIPMEGYTYLYNTKDGGRSWNEKMLPVPEGYEKSFLTTLKPVFFTSKDGVLPVQSSMDIIQYFFYVTHDGGETWTPGNPVNVSANQPFVYDFLDRDHGFGTDGHSMYTTNDGGLNWKAYKTNIDLDRTKALNFVSLKEGYAAVDGTLFKTTDGGFTWSQLTSSPLRAPGVLESRIGKALPYSPETALNSSQNTADTAKELAAMYFEHYLDNSVPESDRLKSYTISDVNVISDGSINIVFSITYSLQGIIDVNSWVSGNYAYAGDGTIKDGMLYITAEKSNSTLKMVSISQDPPLS